MYKTMLVPLDGSKLAEVVFNYAKELAGRLNIDPIFLHICAPDEAELLPMYRIYVEHSAEVVERESQEVQKEISTQRRKKVIKAKGEVVIGYPAEEILRYAEKNKTDLILMATHGRSGITRWAMGSVAEKVLQASKIPVLLVQAGIPEETIYDKLKKPSILVPLDGSKLAESVLPHVEMIARQHGTEVIGVVLLRICEPESILSPVSYYLTPPSYPPKTPVKWDDYVKQETARFELNCTKYLQEIAKRLTEAGLRVRIEVRMGKPADEIVGYATKNPHSLLVMATHGRSGLTKWAYGSVTDKVLHGISIPILLVRPEST